jgi:hypothetical protein
MKVEFELTPGTISLIAGAIMMIGSGSLWALQEHFDNRYFLVADSLQGKLLDRKRDLIIEQSQEKPNQKLINLYLIQIEELKQKLGLK